MAKAKKSPTADSIDPAEWVEWARTVAGQVGRDYRFVPDSAEQDDLNSTAVLTLYEHVHEFDPSKMRADSTPADLFRGWMQRWIKSECAREAKRLRNGGTYHTRRERSGEVLTAEPLGDDAAAIEDGRADMIEELTEREWNQLEDGRRESVPEGRTLPRVYLRECGACGRKFKASSSRRRYCSDACEEGANE